MYIVHCTGAADDIFRGGGGGGIDIFIPPRFNRNFYSECVYFYVQTISS